MGNGAKVFGLLLKVWSAVGSKGVQMVNGDAHVGLKKALGMAQAGGAQLAALPAALREELAGACASGGQVDHGGHIADPLCAT